MLVIASPRLLGLTSSTAAAIEIGIVVVLVVVLLAVVATTGSGDIANLGSRG